MAGLKGSAKEKRVGSLMHMLRDGTVCSQAKSRTYSDIYICCPFLLKLGLLSGLCCALNFLYE